jgi:ATP-dependent RNA helicase RhlE
VPAARTVINYDVPLLPEEYVHRVGRAGHGGGTAEAFTFRCPADRERWSHVEGAMRVALEPSAPPAHREYLRMQDRVAPDAESPRPTPKSAGRAGRGRKAKEPNLADMIRRAPKRARRGARAAGAGATARPGTVGRGTQRKQPIAKGQKPGGGVRRSS